MKMNITTRIWSQPILLLASGGLVIVEGENSAGIFAQFFVNNLVIGNFFAVVGATGIMLLLANFLIHRIYSIPRMKSLLNILGALLLTISISLFFYCLPWEGAVGTFTHALPLATLCLFAVAATGFITHNILTIRKVTTLSS